MHGSKLSNPVNSRTLSDLLSYLDAVQAFLDKAVLDRDFDEADRINAEFSECLSALLEAAMVPDVTELARFRQIKVRHAEAQDALAEILREIRGRRSKVQAALSAYLRV